MTALNVLSEPLVPSAVVPDDLVAELLMSEDRVQHGFEIMRRRGVAVKPQAASRFQQPVHGQQPDRHEAHERTHPVRVRMTRRLDGLHQPRVVVGDLINPLVMNVTFP